VIDPDTYPEGLFGNDLSKDDLQFFVWSLSRKSWDKDCFLRDLKYNVKIFWRYKI